MPRRGLDRATVVDVAVRIADREGLEAVTLARVAGELGVRPPSLYNHVGGRDELVAELGLRGLAELSDALRSAAVGRSGPEALRALAAAYRAYAAEHPGAYAALQRAPASDQQARALAAGGVLETFRAVLRGWGLEGDAALQRIRVIRAGLHGFAHLEAVGAFGLPLEVDEAFELLVATLIAGLAVTLVTREARDVTPAC